MNTRHRKMGDHPGLNRVLNIGLCLCLMGAMPAAWGADSFTATTGAEKATKAPKPKKAKAPKPPVAPGMGESKAERDQRLWRECRGKTNAGACEGYAH